MSTKDQARKQLDMDAFRVRKRIVSTDDCWLYAKYKQNGGYGRTSNGMAHRIMYESVHGPVPAGLELDHLCEVKACCNPDHLEAATRAENVFRGREKKLLVVCEAGLHVLTPDNLYMRIRGGRLARTCRSCALAYAKRRKERLAEQALIEGTMSKRAKQFRAREAQRSVPRSHLGKFARTEPHLTDRSKG